MRCRGASLSARTEMDTPLGLRTNPVGLAFDGEEIAAYAMPRIVISCFAGDPVWHLLINKERSGFNGRR